MDLIARIVRGAWGAVLLIAPGRVLRAGGGQNAPAIRLAVRVLGTRHLIETLILARDDDPRSRRWIAAVDVIHGLSMVALAAAIPRMRRDALLSAASAGALAALSAVER